VVKANEALQVRLHTHAATVTAVLLLTVKLNGPVISKKGDT